VSQKPNITTARRKPAKVAKAGMTKATRMAAVAAVLLLPPLGLFVWSEFAGAKFTTLAIADEAGSGAVVDDAGYAELTPPSRLFGPGTFSTVEELPDHSLRLHLACSMDDKALAMFRITSDTLDGRAVHAVSSKYDASAKALSIVAAKATGDRVKNVAVLLDDMHVVTMPYESLLKIRTEYLKGDCEAAVLWNLKAGAKVCQTTEVLQADIALRIDYSNGVSAEEHAALEEKVLGEIKLAAANTGITEMHGNDLYLGVNDDLKLKVNGRNCFSLKDVQPSAAGSI
jgi:hypothetical protein